MSDIPIFGLRKQSDPDWKIAPKLSDKLHHVVINQRVVQFWNDDKEPWYSYTLWFKPTNPVSTKVRPTKIKEYGVEIITDVPEDPRLVTYDTQTGLYSLPCVGALPEPPYSWEPFATDPGDPEEIRKEIKRALSEYVHTP